MTCDAMVIGAGVIGLTSAIVLAEGGRRVAVWSRDPAGRTTSAVAGGLWWPYRIEPEEQVAAWSVDTLHTFIELAARPEETGVRLVEGTQAGIGVADLGTWAAEVPGLRPARPDELPEGFSVGLRARVPLVDMPTYLGWLRRRLEAAGGTVEERTAASPAEAGRAAPLVVNCTGLGARELVPDTGVHPVQGQLVVVENPGVEEWLVAAEHDASDTLYALPQPYGLVLGGTARENAWGLEPDPATADAIVARCAGVHPRVADARVLAHRVGLRPARSRVRLESERLPDGARVVHNYGHGGAGVTVSWGCARQAALLA
ncbi:FAD-dependent oxidoreductase [Streptomyces sp. NA02950]|uniref:FAD-dependent oxidoreductase n=1 Tax=Streptomyces sp. NA02950 TaxID=2742137 RepID=UPI00159008C4|nr:FAD-dependent oxidoreductase [Streptomyces sp. NA02950]QKV91772.1 FAD-dependent oxidoreductase [Streptomyces sp. NA02950]